MPAKKTARNKRKTTDKSTSVVAKVPQPHGGALNAGGTPGNVGGTGRPPDAIRAAMRELGANKGVPFLSDVLDGKVNVSLVGTCANCGEVGEPDVDWVKDLIKGITTSTDHRIKATEQAMKYGLSSKELVIASSEAASFFDCVYRATVEQVGESQAEAIKARAVALMDAKA